MTARRAAPSLDGTSRTGAGPEDFGRRHPFPEEGRARFPPGIAHRFACPTMDLPDIEDRPA